MNEHPYQRKLDRVLSRMGNLYLAQDLISAINAGRMQIFCKDDSVAITQVAQYPRAKVIEIIAAVGNLEDVLTLNEQIMEWAPEIGASVITAYARRGWLPYALARGWRLKARNYVYQREL
jgi:hypothetical protein